MSILIGNLEPRRATLCTDTLGYLGDAAPYNLTTKAFLLPQWRGLVADRGSTWMAGEFFAWTLGAAVTSFDGLRAQAPDALRRLQDEYLAEHGERLAGGSFKLSVSEMTLIGWSESRERFVAVSFTSEQDFAAVEHVDGLLMTPQVQPDPADPAVAEIAGRWGHALNEMRVPETFIALAELQKWQVERDHGGGSGGEIVMYDLRPEVCEVRTIHRFADYDATVARIEGRGEPAAELEPEGAAA